MRVLSKTVVLAVIFGCGQQVFSAQSYAGSATEVQRFDISSGYQFIKANAPPAGCECFSLSGGYVGAGGQLNQWLGVEGQFSGAGANKIGPLGQDLTLKTYTVGPRASLRYNRFGLHGLALFGRAQASDSTSPRVPPTAPPHPALRSP